MMYLAVPVALFFLAMGLAALARPARILESFGVHVDTPDGRTEVRAVYGGFGVAVSTVLFVGMAVESIRDGVFIAIAVALAGMAGGRLVSALLGERVTLFPTWFFFAVELMLAALLIAAAVL